MSKLVFVGLVFIFSNQLLASKIELSGGGYIFDGKNNRNNTNANLNGFGSYRLAYKNSIFDRFEYDLGYSLLATKGFGGDLSFGFDIGLNYYFLTLSKPIDYQMEKVSGKIVNKYRPFIGFAFVQRNFQSISSQYAGASLKVGTELHHSDDFGWLIFLRSISLLGPDEGSALQTDLLVGINIEI